jgi:hypothetical protein
MLYCHDRRQHGYSFEDCMRMTMNNHELKEFVKKYAYEIVKCAYGRHKVR